MKKLITLLLCIYPILNQSAELTPEQTAAFNMKAIEIVDSNKEMEVMMSKLKNHKVLCDLMMAIAAQESGCNPNAHNVKEDAVGILQIRQVLVDEVNSILGEDKFTYEDRWNVEKSMAMFYIYQLHRNPSLDPEKAARIWNGGPNGHHKESTQSYWKQVCNKTLHLDKYDTNQIKQYLSGSELFV